MDSTATEVTDQQILAITCNNLGSILSIKSETELTDPLSPISPLYSALELLGKMLKITFKFPSELLKTPLEDQVYRIARLSNVNYRSMGLKNILPHLSPVPLLGFYGKNKDPVILKIQKTRCILVDPQTQTSRILKQEEIEQLNDRVYQFYWPLPNITEQSFLGMVKALLRRYWQEANVVLNLGFLIAMASLFFPFANKILFDNVFNTSDTSYLIQLSLGLATISVASSLFKLTQQYTLARLRSLILHDVQMSIWGTLFNSSVKVLKKFTVGEIFEKIDYFDRHQQILGEGALKIMLDIGFSIFFLVLMFFFSVPLTLGTLIVSIIAALIMRPLIKLFLYLNTKYLILDNQLVSNVVQSIRGIQTIRATNSHNRFFASWAQKFIPLQKVKKEVELVNAAFSSLTSIVPLFITLLIYLIVIIQIIGNEGFTTHNISLGSYLAFTAALSAFVEATFATGQSFFSLLTVNPSWGQVKEVLNVGSDNTYVAQSLIPLQGEINIKDVSFSYESGNSLILNNINLTIKKGDFIAIVGPTGCGKSTLLRLLIGLERPNTGSICYDGKDLSQWDLTDLRSQIGCVLQNSKIFDGSIIENIAAGRAISEDLIYEVIRKVGLEDFVRELPMGLYTHLSYGGTTISQGQKQCLLIARALINNPQVILFDEATSALDNLSQKVIAKNLEKLNITRIVVAHRHATIREAHHTYRLRDGVLEEV